MVRVTILPTLLHWVVSRGGLLGPTRVFLYLTHSSRQDFLEQSFPAYHASPTNEAVASAAKGDEQALDREAAEGRLVEPRLNVRNTAIKMLLDQTAGAAANTFMFSMFMNSIMTAMAHRPDQPAQSLSFLLAGGAVDYSRVDWRAVVAKSRANFWGIIVAGWTFWPLVSFVNFAFVKGIEARNLVGSLAGVAWGVYMSLFATQ